MRRERRGVELRLVVSVILFLLVKSVLNPGRVICSRTAGHHIVAEDLLLFVLMSAGVRHSPLIPSYSVTALKH